MESISKKFLCVTRKIITINIRTLRTFVLQRAMLQCALRICVAGAAIMQI